MADQNTTLDQGMTRPPQNWTDTRNQQDSGQASSAEPSPPLIPTASESPPTTTISPRPPQNGAERRSPALVELILRNVPTPTPSQFVKFKVSELPIKKPSAWRPLKMIAFFILGLSMSLGHIALNVH